MRADAEKEFLIKLHAFKDALPQHNQVFKQLINDYLELDDVRLQKEYDNFVEMEKKGKHLKHIFIMSKRIDATFEISCKRIFNENGMFDRFDKWAKENI